MDPASPPVRPPRWEERLGSFFFHALAPSQGSEPPSPTPPQLAPFEEVAIPRRGGGQLAATFYPAEAGATLRGAVLLLHPWLPYGKAYFHRRGRLAGLRAAGYHVLTPDLPGFGGSEKTSLFLDLDIEDALTFLRAKIGPRPVHLWGVSAGGYWAHPVIARDPAIRAAFFEDVAPHLLEWSWRTSPWGRPFYLFFCTFLTRAYAFIDLRRYGAALKERAVTYVVGAEDPGIPAADARELAEAGGAGLLVVPEAPHLGSIKRAQAEILALALALFARAEAEDGSLPIPG